MNSNDGNERRDRWARLRFAVVGPLLASPPPAGKLHAELERLAERDWDHPSGKGPVRFAVSTIERWYYQARAADNDPVGALKRRPRADAGRARAMSSALIEALREQYRAHPSWSAQLHHENLVDLIGNTRTDAGLRVRAGLDTATYPKGVTASDAEMDALSLHRNEFHGDWNYELHPR